MSTREPLLRSKRALRAGMQGFSIIEIMVGLIIGLLTLLAIYQLYTTSEGRRRTVTSVSQAQSAGSMALFAIERDIRSAGIGFSTLDSTAFGCTVAASNGSLSPAEFQFPLVPVRIVDGKKIWVLTGTSGNMFAGARYASSASGEFQMEKSNAGFQPGDVIVGTSDSNPSECLMMETTRGAGTMVSTSNPAAPAVYQGVAHGLGSYTHFYTGSTVTATRNGGSKSNMLNAGLGEGSLYSLGPSPSLHVWSLENNQLMRYNALNEAEASKVVVAQDVIDLVAEYGYDANNNGKIDQSNEWRSDLNAVSPLKWERVIAVRIAVLVRSSHFERDEVTPVQPKWSNGNKTFNMGGAGEDWKHYRYRVYESVIPLRNTIWGQMS